MLLLVDCACHYGNDLAASVFFKGDLLCKNHFYKVFEHSCVAAVCEKIQPIMVKIHPLIFLYSKKIINSLSERAVSDSPSVHVTERKKSRPFVMLPYKHRHSPE